MMFVIRSFTQALTYNWYVAFRRLKQKLKQSLCDSKTDPSIFVNIRKVKKSYVVLFHLTILLIIIKLSKAEIERINEIKMKN